LSSEKVAGSYHEFQRAAAADLESLEQAFVKFRDNLSQVVVENAIAK
jgi:hypothetical protein